MRSYDHVARYGGDEFAVICSGCRPGEIDLPLQRLQRSIEELRRTGAPLFDRVTISVGAAVSHAPSLIHKPDQLVDAADQCLYRAKENGRTVPSSAKPKAVPSARPRLPRSRPNRSCRIPAQECSADAPLAKTARLLPQCALSGAGASARSRRAALRTRRSSEPWYSTIPGAVPVWGITTRSRPAGRSTRISRQASRRRRLRRCRLTEFPCFRDTLNPIREWGRLFRAA